MSDEIKVEKKAKVGFTRNKEKILKENEMLLEALTAGEDMSENKLDLEKLKMLKEKSEKAEVKHKAEVADSVSIRFAVIGLGAAGGRLAEAFDSRGYSVGVINTSEQDLGALTLNQDKKLMLEGSIGGTGKNRDLSLDIFTENKEKVVSFIEEVSLDADTIYIIASGGGGTGSGSVSLVCAWAAAVGLPVGVIYVLPKKSEGAKNKENALKALSELGQLSADGFIDSLIVVDNAKLEVLLSHVGHLTFWDEANSLIVEPLHRFNHLTSTATSDALDPSDFGSILTAGGATIYGNIKVDEYTDETSLAEAIIDSLSSNMLSEGFDLKQSTVGGLIFVASSDVLAKTPSICFDYAVHSTSEATNGATLFKGIYIDDSLGDYIQMYTMFSGLGLPEARVGELQREVEKLSKISKEKASNKVSNMRLDLDKNKSETVYDDIKRKISSKKSGFRKLQRGRGIRDFRKK